MDLPSAYQDPVRLMFLAGQTVEKLMDLDNVDDKSGFAW